MSRRTTLGVISHSAANSRAGMAPRQSLGASKGRASIATASFPSRRTSSAGRKSSAGMNRRSSAIGLNSTRSDPRNITDKRYVPTNVRALIEFLTYHNYDHAISPKILNSPSGKDFNNIVQFLFRLIDQNLSCPGKFEDEVISMFKFLRYPYSISKNGLSAVGSPHSWPQLLASLMWLIELLEYDEEVMNNADADDGMQEEGDLDDTSTSEKAFFSYLKKAYVSFLGGDDDAYNDLTEEFTQSHQSRNTDIIAQTEVLEDQNSTLLKEIAEVESRRLVLPQLQAKKKDYETDLGKFENLISQLEKHKEACQSKITSRESELEKTKQSIRNMEEHIDSLKEKIAGQELSPDDVKRMSEERAHLQESLLATSETSSALQKKVWDAELVLRDRVQNMEEAVRLFNSMSDDLDYAVSATADIAVNPSSASKSPSKSPMKMSKRQLAKAISNAKINIDIRAKKRSELMQTDIRRDVMPPLHQLKSSLSDAIVRLNSEIMALQDASEEEELKTVQVQETKLLLESKLRRAEEAYRKEKTALESLAGSHDREMDALESKLFDLKDVAAAETRQATANRRLSELKSTISHNRESHKKKKADLISAIMQVVTEAANHREHTQRRLGQLTEMHRQRLEDLLLMDGRKSEQEEEETPFEERHSSYKKNTTLPHDDSSSGAYRSPFLDTLPIPPSPSTRKLEESYDKEENEDVEMSLLHDETAIQDTMELAGDDDYSTSHDMRVVSNLSTKFNLDSDAVSC